MLSMIVRVTATEAGRKLSDLLSRVFYRGEQFEIVRNGQVVAILGPAACRKALVKDLFDLVDRHGRDPEFGADLERVQAEQPPLVGDPWAS